MCRWTGISHGTVAPTCGTSAACARATAASSVDRLSAAGWAALQAHGIRTVIDLRNGDELAEDLAQRPPGLTTLHLPLDGVEDTAFWKDWHDRPEFGTPLYAELDVEAYLRAAGVRDDDVRTLRERLVSAAGRRSRPAAATPRPAT